MEERRRFQGDSVENGVNNGDLIKGSDPVKMMKIGEVKRRDKGIPLECDCGVVVSLETSLSPKTLREKEFRCGFDIYGGGEGCGFRMVWEDAVLEEFEKINEDKLELKERLDVANKWIDKQEGIICEMQMQYEEMMADRKQLEDYNGEIGETQIALAKLTDKHSTLMRKVELLEMKYEKVKKEV